MFGRAGHECARCQTAIPPQAEFCQACRSSSACPCRHGATAPATTVQSDGACSAPVEGAAAPPLALALPRHLRWGFRPSASMRRSRFTAGPESEVRTMASLRGITRQPVTRRGFVAAGLLLIISTAGTRTGSADYPSAPQISHDGTAVVLQDYASLPLSSRTMGSYPPPIDFAGQLGRVNFMRSEPVSAPQSALRFFVNDLNRTLYILDKATRAFTPYENEGLRVRKAALGAGGSAWEAVEKLASFADANPRRRAACGMRIAFPGFRPGPTVIGIFGDPQARVIALGRRSKKRRVGPAAACSAAGTIARCAASGISPVATRASISTSRSGASPAGAAARSSKSGSTSWRTTPSTPSASPSTWGGGVGPRRSRTSPRSCTSTGIPSRSWRSSTCASSCGGSGRPARG